MERAGLERLVRAPGCARDRAGCVFLEDPNAGVASGGEPAALPSAIAHRPSAIPKGWLCLATGGTGGARKWARHDERTLAAAVAGVRAHFGLGRINAVDVLPPYHVSGLMARVRAAATGGEHFFWDWKRLEGGELPRLPARDDGWVISLVPTQVHRLLARPVAVEWLRSLRLIFVGGGPVWPALADAMAGAELPAAISYGLTETAAMVTALRPEEFLAGERSSGTALPHARVRVDAEGVVCVAGESVFWGYWPGFSEQRELATGDLGEIDSRGHLRVLGRRDAVIITGGKKVHPEEVEAALRAGGEDEAVTVVGVPDPEWGEMVVACFPRTSDAATHGKERAEALAPHQRPKRFLAIEPWPVLPNGKINRLELRAAAAARLGAMGRDAS